MSAPKVAEKAAEAVKTETPKLPKFALREEANCRRRWFVKAPAGATREDPLYTEFWGPVAKQLARHDIIFLLADDESWELECRVEAVRMNGAEVTISKSYSRKGIVQAQTVLADGFVTQWRPGMGWCVIRVKDDFPVVKGHATEGGATLDFHRSQPRPVV